jgi:hypothetical protein
MNTRGRQFGIAAAIAALVLLASPRLDAEDSTLSQGFLQRVVAQTTRANLAIRAVRELEAGTASGKHQGWMRVETRLTPTGSFSWQVLEEGGSSRTREKVFRAVLQTEADASREGDRDAAAVTPANYTFSRIGDGANGTVQIRLVPRRRDSRLVDGILTVSADGYPLRLEGTLAKSPSFWVKSVHVVRRYGRFGDLSLPTMVESTADVKMIGKSTFTMRYSYTEVNGRSFPRSGAVAELQP